MSSSINNKPEINGTIAPGFESVKRLFQHDMQTMAEENAQLCVYHRGKKVVDLWASNTSDAGFSADSLVNVFSSGKSLEAIAVAALVGQGRLKYEAKISDYWPDFAAHGKGQLSVAQLMRHEAGLANFDTSLDTADLLPANLKQNCVGRIIENQALNYGKYEQGSREYHAITRGWIVNELFRRVDPAGRTIGEFLQEDFRNPLGADVVVGIQEEDLPSVAEIKPLGIGFQFLESLKPKFFGRKIIHNIFQLIGRFFKIIPSLFKGTSIGSPPPLNGMKALTFFNDREFSMGETSSANAKCSARGLAKVAAVMAAGGTLEGHEYLSEAAWQAMHEHPVRADLGSLLTTSFTQGGVALFTECNEQSKKIDRELNQGREGFYGWMGLGGSIFQWHPELDIGFAFVPTSLHALDFLNERGKVFQAEVMRCVESKSQTESCCPLANTVRSDLLDF